jgi:hypothetical protein
MGGRRHLFPNGARNHRRLNAVNAGGENRCRSPGLFFPETMPDRLPDRLLDKILWGLFIVALLGHGWLVTRNWSAGFMPGHEFRQAHTAIVSYYIDQQDNFSLMYETPLFGKPWISLLLEVPVYEWSVVLVSRATDLPHIVAARAVSVTCFYLMLPALYLLLGRYRLPRPERLLILALVLTCPVYIFYSRAFLMESMELLCCAWFLHGFVQMMDRRRWYWFVLATAAGIGAALIKSATFAVWLLPAAGYGAWMLWRDLRARTGWRAPLETIFWGLAGVVIPLGSLRLWIKLTDPLKELHASAWIFTSGNLSQGNWGLTDIGARFSADTWGTLATRWSEAILPPWLILGVLVAGLVFLPRVRWPALALAGVFFLAQLLFPFAYAYQDYYFYACAVFLLAGFGFLLNGLLHSRLPRWVGLLAVAALIGAQLNNYARNYYLHQMVPSNGGFPFTEVLRDTVPKDSVIIVSGADWAGMIPLYAQRKALMIRGGLVNDTSYLTRAFADLADEDVAALVVAGVERGNRPLIAQATAEFGLDPTPTFSHATADIYCNRRYTAKVREHLRIRTNYGGQLATDGPVTPPEGTPHGPVRISSGFARIAFPMVSPAPVRADFSHGFDPMQIAVGTMALFAHPASNLWLRAPAHATRIEWDCGIISEAYERAGDKTDGVEFSVTGVRPGIGERVIFKRLLDPARQPGDRDRQRIVIPYQPEPGELLRFTTGSGPSESYDWAYWVRIDVK